MDYRDPDWVAQQLGIDKNTVYKYLQDGTIPALQLGHKWLISEEKLAAWLSEETQKQTRLRREAATSTVRTVRRMENFSKDARHAIASAHTEARQSCHAYLGQEHLLLGIVANQESPGSKALSRMGMNEEKLREEFARRFQPGDTVPPRRLARTPNAKHAMRLAVQQASADGAKQVDCGHLLLGIMQLGQGAGFEMLQELGVTTQGLSDVINELRKSPSTAD